jgi:hypothetical protein
MESIRTVDVELDELAGRLGERVGSVGLNEVDLGLECCDRFQEVKQSRLVRLAWMVDGNERKIQR